MRALAPPLPAVVIQPIRHVLPVAEAQRVPDLTVDRDPHALVTRVLEREELERELERMRLLMHGEARPMPVRLPSDQQITREMSLDEFLPRAVLGQAARPLPQTSATLHDVLPGDLDTTLVTPSRAFTLPPSTPATTRAWVEHASPRAEALEPAPLYRGAVSSRPVAIQAERAQVRRVLWVGVLGLLFASGLGVALLAPGRPVPPAERSVARSEHPVVAAEPARRAPAASAPVSAKANVASVASQPPQVSDGQASALPGQAAQLYMDGRFKEALAAYRALAALHPENRAYAKFASILRTHLVETCLRMQPTRKLACSAL
jgi:hypothetical protein